MSTALTSEPTSSLKLLQDPSLLDGRGLIAGEWQDAAEGKTFDVYEPSSGNVLYAKERSAMLYRWNDLILKNKEDLSIILSENGKMLAEAASEVTYAASFVSWFAAEAVRNYSDNIPSSYANTMVFTYKEPVGVAAIVTPWNFPAAMITRKVAPALAAGCAVVIKPPSEAQFTAMALARLALEAGVPASCLHVVPTRDRTASLALATHPKVAKLSFTGSTAVGIMLTELAARTMKRVSMELGGNAPFIVFEDADLDAAVDAAMVCKFRCTGQTCVCANRIFVHETVLEPFTDKLVRRVQALQLGRGIDAGTTQGPLVNAAAFKKVGAHVADAVAKGAVVHTGGHVPTGRPGFFYAPTVMTGITKGMDVMTDETFAPLAAVISFTSEAEVATLANDTEFGVAGYFFSADVRRIIRVARDLECGMIGVNAGLISAAESPFGGVKGSGVVREGSKYGLAEYQNIKTVTLGGL